MDRNGIYFSIFYCSIVLSTRGVWICRKNGRARKERPDPETNEDVRLCNDRERYRKDMIQEIIENKGKGSCVELRSLR